MTIVTLGELLIDMFPAEQGRSLTEVSAFYPKPGGAPANVAVAARRLGAETAFIGKVGDDAFGHFLVAVLRREGVETRGAVLDHEARTTMAFIAKPDPDHAEFVFYRNPGADFRLQAAELDQELLSTARILHFGSLSLNHEPARSATWAAIESARQAGALISFDVNYRPALWDDPAEAITLTQQTIPMVDMIKVNEVELALLSGLEIDPQNENAIFQAAQSILDQGVQAVVITLGPHGSAFCSATHRLRAPGFRVETVDAIGCGDAFIAGLLTRLSHIEGLLHDQPLDFIREALTFANAVGALTSTKQGVIPALPTLSEVESFLSEHS